VPPIPRTFDEVDICHQWALTWSGEKFLQFLDSDWGIAICETDENLAVMGQCL